MGDVRLTSYSYLIVKKGPAQLPPPLLASTYPNAEFSELSCIKLSSDQRIKAGVFVMVGPNTVYKPPITITIACTMGLPHSLPFSPPSHCLPKLSGQPGRSAQVACVTSLWQATYKNQKRTFTSIQRCNNQSMVHPVYGMRVIEKGPTETWISNNVGYQFLDRPTYNKN